MFTTEYVDFYAFFKVEIKDLKIDKPNLKSQCDITIHDIASRIVDYEETIYVQMGQKVSEINCPNLELVKISY